MPKQTLSLFPPFGARRVSDIDSRGVNVIYEEVIDVETQEKRVYAVKRPCLANSTQPPAGAAAGRGLYAWGVTGKIYSVFANKIYSGATDLGVTLAGSSGRVWFCETPKTSSAQLLIVSDGADNYNITDIDGITQIDENDDAQYPTSNLGPIDYLDGYLIQGKQSGNIYNGVLNDFDAWDASGVLPGDVPSELEATHLQKDQLFAFWRHRITSYFNNGNRYGSPLLRVEQNQINLGLASKATLAWSGSTCCFVGQNPSGGDGERAVWVLSAGSLKQVSGATINRFLRAEGASITSATAWMERVAGQLVYVLRLSSSSTTFVYNVDNNTWTIWEAPGGGAFAGAYATSYNGTVYVQDIANGRIYTFLPTTFQDSGSNITVTIKTPANDGGTANRKSATELEIVGDTTTGNLGVSYSDNDEGSFSTARNIDMSGANKRLHRLGNYRRRSYKFTYEDNYALRLQAARETFTSGET